MLYREIIAVCSQIHTKHINTLCGQNVKVFYVKPGGTYSDFKCLTFQSLPVTLRTTKFHTKKFYIVITRNLCVVCESRNRQQILRFYNRIGESLQSLYTSNTNTWK